MIALSEKTQLRRKIDELNKAVGVISGRRNKAHRRYYNAINSIIIFNAKGKLSALMSEMKLWDDIYEDIQAYREVLIKQLSEAEN